MHKRRIVIAGAVLLGLLSSAALAEEKRWVVSEGTALKEEAAISAKNVADLAVGAEVSVVEGSGRWMKVRSADGKEGWVFAGRLSDTPPVAEVGGGDGGLFGESMQKSQIQTAKADSARSIRGLSPEGEQYAKQRGTPEKFKKALDKMLERSVKPDEIKTFLREGKIGEYAQ